MPADPQGRHLVGIADAPVTPSGTPAGMVLTVGASGTTPVTVNLGQSAAGSGSRGVVFFGDTGTATTATVTTSGGANNVAQILVRGDSADPSAYQGDLDLSASIGGAPAAAPLSVTVFRIAMDQIDSHAPQRCGGPPHGDHDAGDLRPGTRLPVPVRGTVVGDQIAPPYVETPGAINIIPSGGGPSSRPAPMAPPTSHCNRAMREGIDRRVVLADYSNGAAPPRRRRTPARRGDYSFCTCCPASPPQAPPPPTGSGGSGAAGAVRAYAGEEVPLDHRPDDPRPGLRLPVHPHLPQPGQRAPAHLQQRPRRQLGIHLQRRPAPARRQQRHPLQPQPCGPTRSSPRPRRACTPRP